MKKPRQRRGFLERIGARYSATLSFKPLEALKTG